MSSPLKLGTPMGAAATSRTATRAGTGPLIAQLVDRMWSAAVAEAGRHGPPRFRRVDTHEGVFPMVPAGRPNDEIILGPEFSPEEQAAATRREVRAQ